MKIACDVCNREFNRPFSHIKRNKNNYCSIYCHNIDQQNKIIKFCKFCVKPFNVRISEQERFVTCSSKECRYQNKRGKNNPNYIHGKSKKRSASMSSKKYKLWRKEILKRDKNTCLFCGIHANKGLHVDHIKPWSYFPANRYDISNGRTLCKSCHEKTYKDAFLWKDLLEPHILVDLDSTLAYYDGWVDPLYIGEPITLMVNKVKNFIKQGKKVIIFTARITESYSGRELSQKEIFDIDQAIKSWCELHIGKRLLVTNKKTLYAEAIYDDRAIQVDKNTGKILGKDIITPFVFGYK